MRCGVLCAALPISLSTKLLPEMEAEEAALMKQYQRSVLGQDINTQCENLQVLYSCHENT
jgi:hypothetical protein